MKNENEKKGFFERLTGVKKDKKSSCCGSFRIEEITDKSDDEKKSKAISKTDK